MADEQWVYDFSEGSKDMRELGGKGANTEMTRVLGAERVPAGFTITIEACVAYMKADQEEPEGMPDQVADALARLEEQAGKTLGDSDDPLLVSVRSGARESMPGMLDTVLNLGMNDESVEAMKQTENEAAWDSTGASCRCSATSRAACRGRRSRTPSRRPAGARRRDRHRSRHRRSQGAHPEVQGRLPGAHRRRVPPGPAGAAAGFAIRAVFDSWTGERAVSYRRLNRIPDDWGTAVNVQQMVFGNKGDESATGVAATR